MLISSNVIFESFGSILDSFRIILGIILDAFGDHFGSILEAFWKHFENILEHLGIILGSFWGLGALLGAQEGPKSAQERQMLILE